MLLHASLLCIENRDFWKRFTPREEMSSECDYDVDLFTEMVRSASGKSDPPNVRGGVRARPLQMKAIKKQAQARND